MYWLVTENVERETDWNLTLYFPIGVLGQYSLMHSLTPLHTRATANKEAESRPRNYFRPQLTLLF